MEHAHRAQGSSWRGGPQAHRGGYQQGDGGRGGRGRGGWQPRGGGGSSGFRPPTAGGQTDGPHKRKHGDDDKDADDGAPTADDDGHMEDMEAGVHEDAASAQDFRSRIGISIAASVKQAVARVSHVVLPTPVQSQVIPCLLAGIDTLGIAEAGSGKTLAFMLPAVPMLIGASTAPKQPKVLVLVPTRELAGQIGLVAKRLFRKSNVKIAIVYGGHDRHEQVADVEHASLVIGTPGRLQDLAEAKELILSDIQYVVLDEADRMLQCGFAPALDALRAMMPTVRLTALLSATFPDSVRDALGSWMNRAIEVSVQHSATSICPNLTHHVHVCATHKKPRKLLRMLLALRDTEKSARVKSRVIVFVNKIKTGFYVNQFLTKHLSSTDPSASQCRIGFIHGQLPQARRNDVLMQFKAAKLQILVATDVVGRGIHIAHIPIIVNYDFPGNLEQYMHRVGRGGRQGGEATTYSYFTRNLAPMAPALVTLLESLKQQVDPNLKQLAETEVSGVDSESDGSDEEILEFDDDDTDSRGGTPPPAVRRRVGSSDDDDEGSESDHEDDDDDDDDDE